jgi:hypothetical protein
MQLLGEVVLFHVGQQGGQATLGLAIQRKRVRPGTLGFAVDPREGGGGGRSNRRAPIARGKFFQIPVLIVGRYTYLLEVVRADHFVGRFTDFLDGRQQEGHQDRDDSDDDEEFDEGETPATPPTTTIHARLLSRKTATTEKKSKAETCL